MTLKRVGELAVYVAIGTAFSLGVAWYSFTSSNGGAELIGKWLGLIGVTLILFGYAIRAHKRFVSQVSFWLVILALLVVHLSVFIFIFTKVEHWKVLWFVFAFPVENIGIDAALAATGHDNFGKHGSRRLPQVRR